MIEKNIRDSTEMLVIISKDSIQSRWVKHGNSMAFGLFTALIPGLLEAGSTPYGFIWMRFNLSIFT
jgi:hypothetical protein